MHCTKSGPELDCHHVIQVIDRNEQLFSGIVVRSTGGKGNNFLIILF